MLVLSRKRDESLVIGSNIVVTVVEIRSDKVRLGIEAPANVPVHRQEIFELAVSKGAVIRELSPADGSANAKLLDVAKRARKWLDTGTAEAESLDGLLASLAAAIAEAEKTP